MRTPALASVSALLAAAFVQPRSTQAQPLTRVDVAAWTSRAVALGREAGRRGTTAEARDALITSMCRHARALDPSLGLTCTGDDLAGAGFIVVYVLGPDERLVTVALDGGAVLGNTTVALYHARLGAAPAIRRLTVPARDGRRRATDPSVSGLIGVDRRARTVTVTNRCCAGTEGTTSTWRITARGDLALARVERWRLDGDGRVYQRR